MFIFLNSKLNNRKYYTITNFKIKIIKQIGSYELIRIY